MNGEENLSYSSNVYILNGLIHLDIDKRTLSDKDKEIELSHAGSRLLNILILNANEVISRDLLLREVWEEHNLTPSNGNLNKTIFLIRKWLSEFGFDNVLETIPKQGFILHMTVSPVRECNLLSFLKNKGKIILCFFFVLSLFLLMLFLNIRHSQGDSDFNFMEKLSKCDVYASSNLSLLQAKSFLKSQDGKQVIEECNDHKIDIYIDSDSISKLNVKGEYFVSVCDAGEISNGKNKCENYIFL